MIGVKPHSCPHDNSQKTVGSSLGSSWRTKQVEMPRQKGAALIDKEVITQALSTLPDPYL
jgi:hypothetical protein